MGLAKSVLSRMFMAAFNLNEKNILDAASMSAGGCFLDLGCDEGTWSMKIARRAGIQDVHGVEIVDERIAQAQAKGIKVTQADLNHNLPYDSNRFDLVHANQVIEHLHDVDTFVAEIFRVLKPGGRVIISTENGSSWHNIAAAIMGWQIFSLTNFSRLTGGVGNPIALHRGQAVAWGSWTHKIIFNYRGLCEFLQLHGFSDVKIKGAGYYPLPAFFGRLDPRHSHFITATGIKAPQQP